MWAYHQDERVILIIEQGINRDGSRGINEVINEVINEGKNEY
ncbi:hypothetical protein JJD26997_0976 [Campylobacter jejuni subsp. doylei 269.97]|uniref:Uncharacterized protein n=1 Tax=Campylobacter jejuni subsp. doylei (strain ATCC BAA-1458 / RM4099 / 269.97) TaxID=360109 RepID=A7H3K7_CAMJD|nr:hypothetical protein JJD26997_0976 [Campylobacter jejuni subsp. doylei 269.97]